MALSSFSKTIGRRGLIFSRKALSRSSLIPMSALRRYWKNLIRGSAESSAPRLPGSLIAACLRTNLLVPLMDSLILSVIITIAASLFTLAPDSTNVKGCSYLGRIFGRIGSTSFRARRNVSNRLAMTPAIPALAMSITSMPRSNSSVDSAGGGSFLYAPTSFSAMSTPASSYSRRVSQALSSKSLASLNLSVSTFGCFLLKSSSRSFSSACCLAKFASLSDISFRRWPSASFSSGVLSDISSAWATTGTVNLSGGRPESHTNPIVNVP